MAQYTTASLRGPSRLARYAHPRLIFGGLFALSLLLFLALLRAPRVDGQLIGSDGVYYYLYLRSLAIDHDLDFANEYAYYHLPADRPTPTGLTQNKYAIGPAILWMPFFLAAHALALAGNMVGLPVAVDGYGYLYQAAASIGSMVYGALGLWLAYRCARQVFSQAAALTAMALIWLASNAFYYMVFEPSMSHMVSLFSVALLLTIWFLRFRGAAPPSLSYGLLLGAAGGLVMLVRLQDAPLLLLPFGTVLVRWLQSWRRGDGHARQWFALGLAALVLTLAVFTPQIMAWCSLYGTWIASAYLYERNPAFYWLQPQLGPVLFSTFHGLFTWHPIYLFALIGLLLDIRRDRRLALGLLALLALDLYIVASWWAWWQGDSFGGRMFLNAAWIWVFGLAALLERARARRLLLAGLLIGALLIGWNGLSLVQYRLGLVPMGQPPTWQQMTVDRLKLPWTFLNRR